MKDNSEIGFVEMLFSDHSPHSGEVAGDVTTLTKEVVLDQNEYITSFSDWMIFFGILCVLGLMILLVVRKSKKGANLCCLDDWSRQEW